MARRHEVRGAAWFDHRRSTREFTCYMAGLASPTRRSHLRLDDRRAARPRCVAILLPIGCRASSPTSPRRQGAPVHSSTVHHPGYNRQRCTPYVAVHPLRRDAPDQKGCNAYGSGAPPPTTSTTADISSGHTPTGTQGAQNGQQCTRYDSNALDRKVLH